jgi:hypothetical protein
MLKAACSSSLVLPRFIFRRLERLFKVELQVRRRMLLLREVRPRQQQG